MGREEREIGPSEAGYPASIIINVKLACYYVYKYILICINIHVSIQSSRGPNLKIIQIMYKVISIVHYVTNYFESHAIIVRQSRCECPVIDLADDRSADSRILGCRHEHTASRQPAFSREELCGIRLKIGAIRLIAVTRPGCKGNCYCVPTFLYYAYYPIVYYIITHYSLVGQPAVHMIMAPGSPVYDIHDLHNFMFN